MSEAKKKQRDRKEHSATGVHSLSLFLPLVITTSFINSGWEIKKKLLLPFTKRETDKTRIFFSFLPFYKWNSIRKNNQKYSLLFRISILHTCDLWERSIASNSSGFARNLVYSGSLFYCIIQSRGLWWKQHEYWTPSVLLTYRCRFFSLIKIKEMIWKVNNKGRCEKNKGRAAYTEKK